MRSCLAEQQLEADAARFGLGGGHGRGTRGAGSPDELISGFWELEGDRQTIQLGVSFCQVPLVGKPS